MKNMHLYKSILFNHDNPIQGTSPDFLLSSIPSSCSFHGIPSTQHGAVLDEYSIRFAP